MKILASDFDETLKRNHRVLKSDIDAINRFRKEGNLFGIVTARSFDLIKDALRFHKVPYDFLVLTNGSLIIDHENRIIHQEFLNQETIREIIITSKGSFDICGYTDGIHYRIYDYRKNRLYNLLRKTVVSIREKKCEKIAQFFLLSDSSNVIDSFFVRYSSNPQLDVTRNGTRVLNISAAGNNKSRALDLLKEYYGAIEVYAIGDSHNDLEMIKNHNGYCMDNAEKEIKANARGIVKDFKELIELIG